MTGWARFWAIDLHVHTPASRDVSEDVYGAATPVEVVDAAIAAGLDAIAVTDHNTSAWCDVVADAAGDRALVVLPGVEISTSEGHLLAVFNEGTPAVIVDQVLVRLGIRGDDQGKLDIAAEVGFADAAHEVAAAGGLAIAAHVDRSRGLLQLPVAAHLKRTLLDESLAAVEIVDEATEKIVAQKVGDERILACVRSSDVTLSGSSDHVLAGIGNRRTWVKAARPDLIGIRHALNDPELRVSLAPPLAEPQHPVIESLRIAGGFLDGTRMEFSPDLNCLLGGTGAGKSLALEAMRYALGQQVDGSSFPTIREEVSSRLSNTLDIGSTVHIEIRRPDGRYLVERAFGSGGDVPASTFNDVDGEWVEISADPASLLQLEAFSQGEVLEYARQPVGRMSLVDGSLALSDLEEREDLLATSLEGNAEELVAQRDLVAELREATTREDELEERVRELSAFFDRDVVKRQEDWKSEDATLDHALDALPNDQTFEIKLTEKKFAGKIETNNDVFDEITAHYADLRRALSEGVEALKSRVATAKQEITDAKSRWDQRYQKFSRDLDAELAKMGGDASLVTLRSQLSHALQLLVDVREKKRKLTEIEQPRLDELSTNRERLLSDLQTIRDERRQRRRARVAELNKKTAGLVKLDVSSHPDPSAFRECLDTLKIGSRVRDSVLNSISSRIHPIRFARELMSGDTTGLVDEDNGIDAANLARILTNIADRNLWHELLKTQICDMPDRLDIKFRRPDDRRYVAIEELAHGQKCTAVLVVLLADGDAPVIVDQPEDALHAPWIEDYLVEQLRTLRGARQYIFATRSPGIVVGADAEQIITMKATAGRGELEASGSLERYDLNILALHHLEGGPMAFRRRSGKLSVSVDGA